ncbi:MAG: hypothetical protein C4293_11520 [Nitrospiraceae bacterium]
MDNQTKCEVISAWIDPEERVTVDFFDEKGLNAEITGCSLELVELALETSFLFYRQTVSIPLSQVELGEDRSRYTRDPEKPLHYGRLRLIINHDRPKVV